MCVTCPSGVWERVSHVLRIALVAENMAYPVRATAVVEVRRRAAYRGPPVFVGMYMNSAELMAKF